MKPLFVVSTLAMVIASVAFAQSQPLQNPIDLSGIWFDGKMEVTITQVGNSVNGTYTKDHHCDYQDGSGKVEDWTPKFAVTLNGKSMTGTGTACYYGKGNSMGVGIKIDKVELTVNPDGKTLDGTQLGYNGTYKESFTLVRKERSLCPDTAAIEAFNKVADHAADLSGIAANHVSDSDLQRAFSDSQKSLGGISNALSRYVKLGQKCSEIHDAINEIEKFKSAIDAINSAGCDSRQLARGFDDLFKSAGQIGKRFVKLPELQSWFDLLAEDKNFFSVVSGDLNPEQRWASQFSQVEGYLPTCPR